MGSIGNLVCIIIKEKRKKLRQKKKMAQLRKGIIDFFFFTATDTISIVTIRKATAIVAGNSGIVGEGSRPVGEGVVVEVRLVGEGVVEDDVWPIAATYSDFASY